MDANAPRNIFYDDWRECLRSHFIHVLVTGDAITEPTLRDVLRHAGISEEELAVWIADAEQERLHVGDHDQH